MHLCPIHSRWTHPTVPCLCSSSSLPLLALLLLCLPLDTYPNKIGSLPPPKITGVAIALFSCGGYSAGLLGYVTLRYATLRYVTLRYVTLRYVTLRYVTLRYVTLRYVTLLAMKAMLSASLLNS